MAIFEIPYSSNFNLDDTVSLTATITNFRTVDGHTEYILKVHRDVTEEQSWTVIKRYKEFALLHKELNAASYNIHLPPKKYIGNLNRQFILERQSLLQKYLNDILNNIFLASSLPLRKFLDPENYNISFQSSTLQQNACMAVRDKPDFYYVKALPNIGWRIRKTHCLLRQKNEPVDKEFILSWLEYGPDKCLDFRETQAAFKVLLQLQNSYIVPIVNGSCYNAGALVIHSCCCEGSLRDILYSRHRYELFLNKCQFRKEKLILKLNMIITISVQVLRALQFLHDYKIPYGNLHSGNIFIEDGVAKISDIENGILGVPSLYRPYIVQCRRVRTVEDIDVYCFGHLLYEMALGEHLQHHVCREFPPDCDNIIKPILELILSDRKEKLPTVSMLLNHPTFAGSAVRATYSKRPHCKISSQTRNYFDRVKSQIEKRLHEDQQKLKLHRRLTHLQKLADAEENENFNNSGNNKRKKCKVKKSTSQMSIGTSSIGDSISSLGTPTSVSTDPQTPLSFSSKDGKGCTTTTTICSDNGTSSPRHSPVNSDNSDSNDRSAFLRSIVNFNKNNLRKPSMVNGGIM